MGFGRHLVSMGRVAVVFAMWVARKGSAGELAGLATSLSQSRDSGVANIEEIAAKEHAAVGLNYDECLTYLRDHLYFYLGPRERAGLDLFQQHASRLGLLVDRRAQQSMKRHRPSPLPLGEG